MKKVALSDTVSVEMSRRLCVERVHLRISSDYEKECEKRLEKTD